MLTATFLGLPEIPLSILLLACVFVAICFWLRGGGEELERIPSEPAEDFDLASGELRRAFVAAQDRHAEETDLRRVA